MNWWIATYLLAGALFGLATFSLRHHFSEGTARSGGRGHDPLDGRLVWVLLSSCLWPLFALTGLYTRVLRAVRR